MSTVNPDLSKERASATFNVEALTNVWDGGAAATKRRREIQEKALQDPVLTGGEPYHFLSRPDQYGRAVQKCVTAWRTMTENGYLNKEDTYNYLAIAFPSESPAFSLHWVMFIPTLVAQCSDEQREKWLPLALSGKLIGTYTQTELGHGTNLRALETTATFDPSTDEFIIDCPTLTAMKWWPGGLGKTTNCCIVMAQLVLGGKQYGMHPFMVQFRSSLNHEPLPGVTVGDIGPKFGYDTIDNGFLKFDNFRIPRQNMLMKHAKVLQDGSYVSMSRQKKPAYGVMTLTRTGIVDRAAARGLAIGVTIAIRYSAVRRQSELKPGAQEPQVLDYQTQQYKLFPYLAMAYAFRFSANQLWTLYDQAMSKLESGNDVMMPELHALSSCLKAFCTHEMNFGIDLCRRACGGHGYSHASGLPKLYVAVTPACTFEGENTVLLLQGARYLLRCYNQVKSNPSAPLPESISYLTKSFTTRSLLDHSLAAADLIECFQYRACGLVHRAGQEVDRLKREGFEEWRARNESGVDLVKAAEAHSEAFVIRAFCDKAKVVSDRAISRVLTELYQLLACFWILRDSGEYLQDGFLSKSQIIQLRTQQSSLLSRLRPNAVSLVDAFDYPDHALSSVLGRYDGNVYENLYEWAKQSPLNKTQVHESYNKFLKPMMHQSKI